MNYHNYFFAIELTLNDFSYSLAALLYPCVLPSVSTSLKSMSIFSVILGPLNSDISDILQPPVTNFFLHHNYRFNVANRDCIDATPS